MIVTVKKEGWFHESGQAMTREEKESIRQEVLTEVDQDLEDTGFQGMLKQFVCRYLEQ